MAADDDKDGCELDFTQHTTSPAEVEDFLDPEAEDDSEDDD